MKFHPGSGLWELLFICAWLLSVSWRCHCLVMFCLQACSHFAKVPVVLFVCCASVFKCVNEAAFLCCWPVDKLSYRLTAITVVLPRRLGVCVCVCICMCVWSQRKFPWDVRLLINLPFIFPFLPFLFLPNPAFLCPSSSPQATIHIKEYCAR